MNRRQFLGGLLSLPFWGSAKRSEATPVQSGSTPPREAVGGISIETTHLSAEAVVAMSGPCMVTRTSGHLWSDGIPRFVITSAEGIRLVEDRGKTYVTKYPTAPKGDV